MATTRICRIEDCAKPVHIKGFCRAHYERLRKHGDPLAGGPPRAARGKALDYFHNVVLPYDGDDCLIWPFPGNVKGYPVFRYKERMALVSRIACTLVYGPAPTVKHDAAHSCGNTTCCNPRHLRWATRKENNADKITHGTTNRGENHYGTLLTEYKVREIRNLIGKKSQKEVAKMFGVSRQTIYDIKTGKTWRHLKN